MDQVVIGNVLTTPTIPPLRVHLTHMSPTARPVSFKPPELEVIDEHPEKRQKLKPTDVGIDAVPTTALRLGP